MAMISKTVSGSAEEYKYIKDGKNYPKSSASGTQRTSFTGSSDPRPAGPANANMTLLDAPGLIDDGPKPFGASGSNGAFSNNVKR